MSLDETLLLAGHAELAEALRATHGASLTSALDAVADALRVLFPEADTVAGSGDQ